MGTERVGNPETWHCWVVSHRPRWCGPVLAGKIFEKNIWSLHLSWQSRATFSYFSKVFFLTIFVCFEIISEGKIGVHRKLCSNWRVYRTAKTTDHLDLKKWNKKHVLRQLRHKTPNAIHRMRKCPFDARRSTLAAMLGPEKSASPKCAFPQLTRTKPSCVGWLSALPLRHRREPTCPKPAPTRGRGDPSQTRLQSVESFPEFRPNHHTRRPLAGNLPSHQPRAWWFASEVLDVSSRDVWGPVGSCESLVRRSPPRHQSSDPRIAMIRHQTCLWWQSFSCGLFFSATHAIDFNALYILSSLLTHMAVSIIHPWHANLETTTSRDILFAMLYDCTYRSL